MANGKYGAGRKIFYSVLGVAKVISGTGSSVFNALKFSEFLGFGSTLSKIIGGIVAIGTLGITIVTRFYSLYYPKTREPLQEGEQPPTCCSPGIPTNCKGSTAYVYTSSIAGFYMLFSGLSAILSIQSLLQLTRLFINSDFNEKCGDKNESAAWKIILVNTVMLIQMMANIASFLKYNRPNLDEYFKNLLTKGMKNLSWSVITLKVLSNILGTISIIFSNKHLFDILQEDTLCHITGNINPIPNDGITLLTFLSLSSNLSYGILLNIGAEQRKEEQKERIRESQTPKGKTSEFKCCDKSMHTFIMACSALDVTSCFQGSVVSIATLPEVLTKKKIPTLSQMWDNNPGYYTLLMMSISLLGSGYQAYNLWRVNVDGYANELRNRGRRASGELLRTSSAPLLSSRANQTTYTPISSDDPVFESPRTTSVESKMSPHETNHTAVIIDLPAPHFAITPTMMIDAPAADFVATEATPIRASAIGVFANPKRRSICPDPVKTLRAVGCRIL